MLKIIAAFFSVFLVWSASAKAYSYFDHCQNPNAGWTTIPFSNDQSHSSFDRYCAPDVLYSWADYEDGFHDLLPADPLRGKGYAYTWRTPIGSFGYGLRQIRYKLKNGVNFRWIDELSRNCNSYSDEEKSNTIYVAWLHAPNFTVNAVDYIICSPEVVESWSIGTYGAYVEAVKELNFIKEHAGPDEAGMVQYDGYSVFGEDGKRFPNSRYDQNRFFSTVDPDKTNWRYPDDHIGEMKELISKIYYAQGVQKNPKNHFTTKPQFYFALSPDEIKEASTKALKP